VSKYAYEITIPNWEKHNGKQKRGHTHFMVSKRIFDNEMISKCNAVEFRMYLYCLAVAADFASGSISLHAGMLPRYLRVGDGLLSKCLESLERYQLLKVSKTALTRHYITLQDKTVHDITRSSSEVEGPPLEPVQHSLDPEPKNELVLVKPQRPKKPKKEAAEVEGNRAVWQSYRDAFVKRWNLEPKRNATVNGQVAQLVKRLGAEDAVAVVKFYVEHNKSFYLQNTHAFGYCLKDAETLYTQMKRNQPITQTHIRQYEKQDEYDETIRKIYEEGI